jgi:hypothetical protein
MEYINSKKQIEIPTQNLDLKEKEFDILLDIKIGLGSRKKLCMQ